MEKLIGTCLSQCYFIQVWVLVIGFILLVRRILYLRIVLFKRWILSQTNLLLPWAFSEILLNILTSTWLASTHYVSGLLKQFYWPDRLLKYFKSWILNVKFSHAVVLKYWSLYNLGSFLNYRLLGPNLWGFWCLYHFWYISIQSSENKV